MKSNIAKNTLSFSCSKSMKFIRTPLDIWESLSKEFDFTIDACASDINHLLPKYYTQENSCLDKDWTGEIVYCHPMFDMHIGNFVKKCAESKCLSIMLIPASTHTRYFHKYIWDKEANKTRENVEVRFLEKPNKGFNFGHEDGTFAEIQKGKVGYIKPLMIVIFNNL
ncbi:MAG: DNA N-6-adenine-methyltransferase [Candidatus Izemoplasmatales bacterium]|nr:DNA N-6-adenine-methyltransferase [Candidatus Izemoplasmatales bacterium]